MNPSKALLLGFLAVLCWSTVATAFKIALSYQHVSMVIAIASGMSLALLAGLLTVQGRLTLALQSLRLHWRKALMFGMLNPLIYYFVLLWAYELLPAQVAQPINYTWAIMLALLSVPFLGHKLAKTDLISLVVCYIGVIIISQGASTSGKQSNLLGVGLALLSTLIWAFYWILNSKDDRRPIIALFQNFLMAFPFAVALALFFNPQLNLSWQAFLSSAYIGLFEMGIAFVLWLYAMRLTDNTSRISNLIFLAPFISLALIYFVLGEAIHSYTYYGLALIIIGLAIQTSGSKHSEVKT